MNKEGSLGSVHLLQMLGEIFTERFTGAMRLESGNQVRILYFNNGDIVSCGTNVNAEKIDEVLLSLGKITREHIREVLEMSASSSEIGKRMLSLGFLSSTELDDALRYQTLLIVRNLIHAVDGTFSLVENYTPTRTDVFHYPTHHFISDFLRATDDRELIFSILPPPATRVKSLPGAAALIDTLPWGTEEKGVAANLNGRVSLAELTGLSRLREMDIYKLVAVLACLGTVEVADDAEAPPPASPAREPEQPAGFAEIPSFAQPESPVPPLSAELFPQTRPGTKPVIGIPKTHTYKARSRRLFVIYPIALIGIALVGFGGVLAWQKLMHPHPKSAPAVFEHKPAQPAPIVLQEPAPSPGGTGAAQTGTEDTDMILSPPKAAIPPSPSAPAVDGKPIPAQSPANPPVLKPESPKKTPPTLPVPAPAQPLPAATPAPKPAPPAAPASTPSGSFAEQARSHYRRIQGRPSSHLTLQLMIACQEDSISKALAVDRDGALWFVPFAFKGKDCYKVYWGDYSSAPEAQSALNALPDTFRSGKPQVVSLGAALKNASP